MEKKIKDLEYYLSLQYKYVIEPVKDNGATAFEAFIPTLGRSSCLAYGETEEEALQSLKELKNSLISFWFKNNYPIPEPMEENSYDIEYSGKILVRTTKDMHRTLAELSKAQGVSLNLYTNQCIALGVSIECFKQKINESFDSESLSNSSLLKNSVKKSSDTLETITWNTLNTNRTVINFNEIPVPNPNIHPEHPKPEELAG